MKRSQGRPRMRSAARVIGLIGSIPQLVFVGVFLFFETYGLFFGRDFSSESASIVVLAVAAVASVAGIVASLLTPNRPRTAAALMFTAAVVGVLDNVVGLFASLFLFVAAFLAFEGRD